jgi:hypothetical protein
MLKETERIFEEEKNRLSQLIDIKIKQRTLILNTIENNIKDPNIKDALKTLLYDVLLTENIISKTESNLDAIKRNIDLLKNAISLK